MKRFGTMVLCYEFWWSLAGLQARRQKVQGKDDDKQHDHSAFNPSCVAESRMGSRCTGRVINFIKCQSWKKKWKGIAMCHFQTLRFSIIMRYSIHLIFFFCLFWRATRANIEDHRWSADHSLKTLAYSISEHDNMVVEPQPFSTVFFQSTTFLS